MIVNQENGKEYYTSGYSYTIHGTALSPASTEGAVPSMSADLGPNAEYVSFMQLYRKPILLEEFNVSALFYASEPTDTDGITTIAGMSDLENLNVDLTWPANHGDVYNSIGHLIHAVRGVNPIAVDAYSWDYMEKFKDLWVMPNVQGNGWVLFKQYLSALGLTLYEHDWWSPINAIKLNTEYDSHVIDGAHIVSSTVTLNTTDPADLVVVQRYEYTDFLDFLSEVTPRFEVDEESKISVDKGEVVEAQVHTTFSMTQIETNRPRCVDMAWDFEVDYYSSVYAVFGNDEQMIQAKEWTDAGGDLWVDINKDDPSVLDVKVTGANLPDLAPFTIGVAAGNGFSYSSLHVFGRGVAMNSYPVKVHTGVVRPVQSEEELEIDNPFLCLPETLPNALFRAARSSAGFDWNLSFSMPPHQGIMKVNDRVLHKGHWWRIDSVTISQDLVSYTCTEATEISHLNEVLEGKTIADFNARFAGVDMVEFTAEMLNG